MTTPTLCPVLHEPELRALLLAASHAPECDTIRGAIADWLEERSGTEECGVCKGRGKFTKRCRPAPPHKRNRQTECSTCSGSGRVSDLAGQWAELIRVEVQLARWGCVRGDGSWMHYYTRQSTLLAAVETRLRRVARCGVCDGGNVQVKSTDCPACHGGGYTGVLARTEPCGYWSSNFEGLGPDGQHIWLHDLHWHRGLPYRVDATIAEWWDSDRDKPSKFARRVVAWMPCLTELWVSDREPVSSYGARYCPLQGKDSFDWCGDLWRGQSYGLTAKLFEEVGKEADCFWGGGWAEFAAADRARSALARAMARLARREGERADEVGERHAERITAEINRLLAGNPDPKTVRLQDEGRRRRRARE